MLLSIRQLRSASVCSTVLGQAAPHAAFGTLPRLTPPPDSARAYNVRKSRTARTPQGAVRATGARRRRRRPPPRSMGQSYSTEARLEEIHHRLLPAARQRVRDLGPAAAAEKAAGTPPAHGSKQALHQAAIKHLLQLHDESTALCDRLGECCQ